MLALLVMSSRSHGSLFETKKEAYVIMAMDPSDPECIDNQDNVRALIREVGELNPNAIVAVVADDLVAQLQDLINFIGAILQQLFDVVIAVFGGAVTQVGLSDYNQTRALCIKTISLGRIQLARFVSKNLVIQGELTEERRDLILDLVDRCR